ncbi:MAG: RHS repeat-associated core domain-containing protein [Clostridiales bacterium]|nr:RHS repeat-associated core domain-containing protein [Clostridiales bacterium]
MMMSISNDPPIIEEYPDITTTTHIWVGDEIQVDKVKRTYYIVEETEPIDGGPTEQEFVQVTETTTVKYLHGLKLIESTYGTYIYDAHGDVTAIVGMFEPLHQADPDGEIEKVFGMVASYDHDPFGMPPVARQMCGNMMQTPMGRAGDDAAGLADGFRMYDKNPYRYCGEYLDIETGYIYLRARYYDPSIGRFVSEDSAHDGYNWYAYCANNPIRYIDPSGMFWKEIGGWFKDNWVELGTIALGVALCFIPGTQALGVSLIVGGASSLAQG